MKETPRVTDISGAQRPESYQAESGDRYEVVREIGRGGTAVVYLARDVRHGRDVALKVLRRELTEAVGVDRFLREIQIVAQLQHPHILPLYDSGMLNGSLYYVMPFVEGESLRDRLRRAGPLPLDEALSITREVAVALGYAHARGVVHRDIKPANILLSSGHALVADFGLARIVGGAAELGQLTQEGVPVGTPAYMSPEQWSGEAGAVDGRGDLYSLACVLYEMLIGEPPFPGPSVHAMFAAHLMDTPQPVARRRADVPDDVSRTLARALAKSPEARFKTADEFLESLGLTRMSGQRAARRSSVAAAQQWWRDRPRLMRQRTLRLGAALGLAALLGAGAYAVWQSRQVPFARRDWVLLTDFENATGDSVFDRSLATAVSVSVQQSAHVNVVPAARSREWLPRIGKKETDPITEAVARDLAQRVGARAVVSFAIARLGDVYMLSARIVDPESGATLSTQAVRASGRENVLDALDELSRDIRRALGESRRSVRRTVPLPIATTSSLEALKRYAEGQREYDQAHYEEARTLWQAAVGLDSNFARAHASLGALFYYGSNDRVSGEQHFAKALALRERLTERERMWIAAQVATARDNREEALRLLAIYTEAYPDDEAAWASIGYNNMRLGRCAESIKAYQRVLELDPQSDGAYTNTGTCYMSLRDSKRALEAFQKGTALRPSAIMHPSVNDNYGSVLGRLGRYAEAESVYRLMLGGEPPQRGRGRRSLALLAMLRGRYDSAALHLREGVLLMRSGRSPTGEIRNRLYLAMAYDRAGRGEAQRSQLDSAFALSRSKYIEPTFLALLGQALARSGDAARAQAVLDTVTARANLDSPTDRGMLELLRGELLLAQGKAAEAVGHMELGFTVDSSSYLLEALANALAEKRDLDAAATRFQQIVEREDRGYEGQEFWTMSHYQLGRLFEAKGDVAEATRWYQKLLDIWKEADPGLPLLRDVQERMGRLRGERKPSFNMG